jgi:cell division protein FtsL
MKKITLIAILTSMLFSTFVKADEIQIVVVKKPSVLEEGTQRDLSPAQIAELLPWAKDSKSMLSDLLENIQGLGMTDKVSRMVDGIQQVVGESAPKNSELFMRYVLNRALVLNDMLDKEIDADAVGAIDVKSRVLVLSIKMAIKYYDIDSAKLADQKVVSPFASFGKEYFYFLKELNKSIFDASAQYKIERTSLEWLQWDLYRDLNNTSYASTIIKINNALRIFPSTKLTDSQSINYIKQVRKVSEGLDLGLKEVVQDKVVQDKVVQDKVVEKSIYGNNADIVNLIGLTVIDKDGKVGIVKDVFASGVAKVRFEGTSIDYDRQASELSKEVKNIGDISAGIRVIDKAEKVGIVKSIFANGMVKVRFEGTSIDYDRQASDLSKEVQSVGDISVRIRVIDKAGKVGIVKSIYANEMVKVRFDGVSIDYDRQASDLSKEVQSIDDISAGIRVIDKAGKVGIVKSIYANGMVKVRFDGVSIDYDRQASELSKLGY